MQEIHDLGKMIGHTSVLFRRHLDQAIAGASGDDTGLISGRNFWILRYLHTFEGSESASPSPLLRLRSVPYYTPLFPTSPQK